MWKKRAIVILSAIQIGIFLLIARLVQIQLISTESFSKQNVNLIEASVAQRTQEMVIDDGRGTFVDRHGKPLTKEYTPSLILFPFLKEMEWPVEKVAAILDISPQRIIDQLKKASKPFIFSTNGAPFALTEEQMEKINQLHIPGVFAVKKQRPLEKTYAPHLIGFTREDARLLRSRYPKRPLSPHVEVGIHGLQKAFDEFLIPEGETKLLYHVDAEGGPLFGINVKYSDPGNPFYPVSVKTTLDRDLQQIAETVVQKHRMKKGGIVLLDIKTNSVLAMVSRPDMDPRNPYKNRGAENQMILPQIPGSIFKTVIAAAALETGIVSKQTMFDCSKKIDGVTLDNVHSYGMLGFDESFAASCNNAFATLGKKLVQQDPDILEIYAKKLGLYPLAGWQGDVYHEENFKQFPEERKGTIWHDDNDKRIPLAVAQTSIGQKDVRVSPLAVANMMATIARNGEAKQVRAVSKILYKNGTTFFTFPEQPFSDEQPISPATAGKLQQLLRKVVTDQRGTGRQFQSLPYEVAGKSGTAETGKISHHQELINKWFAGYFPAEAPRYALVVVELDSLGAQTVANDVFFDLVQKIYEFDHRDKNER
ncbi:peptidoglycan D,D-transpeptidase FtsI family protein [Parageobacillus thermoglucosidasius]|uniref:peptidoglycan D,D-transpeptidase FtsI family protein n=1 Tax=Parageobacillus thermoglucosidasius TaxID=1426 RepID=UPI0001D17CDF|nr:penicillin-binding protein 2 [Parageobacillus thermoglucosidasius]AEH47088.1 Peptidoglycan glycosyltransferase [Parageobacillus thermoglucosidasius C56-YS93]